MDSPPSDRSLADAGLDELLRGLEESSQADAGPYCLELIRRFEPLLRKAWRHVPPIMEYGDFVNEVFVRLFGRLPQIKDRRAFPGYFRRVVQSTLVDILRRREPPSEPLEQQARTIASRIDEEILAGVFLQSYLNQLSKREREVLQLEWIDGLSPDEVARRLGLTSGGASAAKSRALSKLRSVILREAKTLRARRVLV